MKKSFGKKRSLTNGFTLIDLLVGIQIMALVVLLSYTTLRLFQHYFVTNVQKLNKQVIISSKLYSIQRSINKADEVIEKKESISYFKKNREIVFFGNEIRLNSNKLDSVELLQLGAIIRIKIHSDTVLISR